MIRNAIALALLATCLTAVAAPLNEEPLATRVSAVTVYEDRAMVTRSVETNVPAGVSTLRLAGCPAALEESSLRAALEGTGLKVLSVATRAARQLNTASAELRKAEEAVELLENQRDRLQARRQALENEATQLAAFATLARRAIAERATSGMADVDEFRKAAALFPERQKRIAGARREIDAELDKLKEQLEDATARMGKISFSDARTLRTVDVTLEAAQPARATVNVSYVIRGCGWKPRYDARLIAGALHVAYQGEVRQKTGEDWTDVQMALSTARPALGARRPRLPMLAYRTASRDVEEKHKLRAVMTEAAEKADGPAAGEEIAAIETDGGVEASASDTGLSVLFKTPAAVTVPSDGRAHKVPVTSFVDATPELSFETVPEIARAVYLRCDTRNATAFPMLAGPVDIWRESGFIGTSHVKFIAPGAPMALSFGTDENLKVRRVSENNYHTDSGLISTSRTWTRSWRVEIANYHPEAKTVRVREHIPVSDVEEVSVALAKTAPEPTEYNVKTGLLLWEVALDPGKTSVVRLEYTVTLPQGFNWRP